MPIFQADLPMFGFYVGGKIIVVNKIGYLEPHHVICGGYKKGPNTFFVGYISTLGGVSGQVGSK